MATMPDLIAVLEKHRVDAGPTLELFGRRLREAGRITKGKRGRGAAQMTFLDGARMLIACAATDHPERAVDAEYEFSNTIYHGHFGETNGKPETLDLAVAGVLEALANGSIDEAERAERALTIPRADEFNIPVVPVLWLIVDRSSVQAELRVRGESIIYQHRGMTAICRAQPGDDLTERTKDYEHAIARFRSGKNLRAEFNAALLRDAANLIGGATSAPSLTIPPTVAALLETYRR